MKLRTVFYVLAGFALIVIVFAVGLTWSEAKEEQLSLESDLRYRTRLLADSLDESIEPYYLVNSRDSIQKIVDKFTNREKLVGLVIYDKEGIKIASSKGLSDTIINEGKTVPISIKENRIADSFFEDQDGDVYVVVYPLHQGERVAGAFMVVQDADYIGDGVWKIWKDNLLKIFAQVFLFFVLIFSIIWWVIYRPIGKIVESVRSARVGKNFDNESGFSDNIFFRPLIGEIAKMASSLTQARTVASEEARLRLEKLDTPWTAERLKEFIKAYLKDRQIFVVSNREPYIHHKEKKSVAWSVPASGVVTAIEPVMEACGGMWLAHGSGDADKEISDENGKLKVPPDDPKYTLKRIWLDEDEIKGHYTGYSNEALAPLCLLAHNRPVFNNEDWRQYRRVNGKFAKALLSEIKNVKKPLILVQDYHFALLPSMIKKSRPDADVCLFWHIPWPSAESFSICPQRLEILEGMLGADVLGFHTQQYCNNFIDTVSKELESKIDFERFAISRENHLSFIKTFPISIAFSGDLNQEGSRSLDRGGLLKLGIKSKLVGIGVDRMDYVKGIIERFKSIEVFLDNHPDYVNDFTFLQIAPFSRQGVAKCKEYADKVQLEAERINKKFANSNWKPIVLETRQYTHKELEYFYRMADICMVTSLHDGMNLVAKEFVASRDDETGVLMLSYFTGAAKDMKGAILVNPYNIEKTAESIHDAITMPVAEQARRMKIMRTSIKNYNIYRWSAEILKTVSDLG